jgi:hypothetical protein
MVNPRPLSRNAVGIAGATNSCGTVCLRTGTAGALAGVGVGGSVTTGSHACARAGAACGDPVTTATVTATATAAAAAPAAYSARRRLLGAGAVSTIRSPG